MKVYVLTKAMVNCDEYLDVTDTQLFRSIAEARQTMMDDVNHYLKDEDDDWKSEQPIDENAISVHLSCHHYEDEVVWAISEHEI